MRRIILITGVLLLSLLRDSTQHGNGPENGDSRCGPQSLALNSSDQTLVLTWEDHPSCSELRDMLIYELVVLVADRKVHYDEVAVTADQIRSTHSWKWTSHLALQCASHSVRLRSRYHNQTSPWKQAQSLPGIQSPKQKMVFPKDRIYEAGSLATFCCIVPAGDSVDQMCLRGYNCTNMSPIKISNQTYALTLHLNQALSGCIDVNCIGRGKRTHAAACVYIGYPPGDRDLQCETRDLESVECHWKVGRDTQLPPKSPTVYQLLGSPCAGGSTQRCSQKVQVDVGVRNWTLKAQNKLGELELHDRADLTQRIHMFAPEGVTASTVNARNVSVEWRWPVQQYSNLSVTCQVNVSHGEGNNLSQHFGVGLNVAVLNDLIPNWTYNLTVRCATAQHFWKWGDWSKSVSFHTKKDVPEALDVWMQIKENHTVIIWKTPLANQSHGRIIGYEVAWAKTTERDQQNPIKVPHSKHSHKLSLDTSEEHIVTVTATNANGSSAPSAIIIPSISADKARVSTSRINGSSGGFTLSWSASPTASCGYVVDWCPADGSGAVEWLKVPPNKTNVSIFSKRFKDGQRYLLSVYACTQGAPVLLERKEGYVRETRMDGELFNLTLDPQGSDVEVSWDPIPLENQTAFIRGYTLYYMDHKNNKVFSERTEHPDATSLRVRNLKFSSYTFTLTAQTALGECGNTSKPLTLNPSIETFIKVYFMCLGAVFCLLSVTTILCYRHWACIKQKVYPPIPKPVLTDKWLTSPGEHSCHHLRMDLSRLSEADIMAIPELYYKSSALMTGCLSQEDMPFALMQTPNIVFPNPSYDPMIETEDQQSSPGPAFQEGTPTTRSSSGYQPHSQAETVSQTQPEEDLDSPMKCVFTYIVFPQTPST